jgi:hypothetical protein
MIDTANKATARMLNFNEHLPHEGLTNPNCAQFLEPIMRWAVGPVKCIYYISIYAPCAFYDDRFFLFREAQHLFAQPSILWNLHRPSYASTGRLRILGSSLESMHPIVPLDVRNSRESLRHSEQQVGLADNQAVK